LTTKLNQRTGSVRNKLGIVVDGELWYCRYWLFALCYHDVSHTQN